MGDFWAANDERAETFNVYRLVGSVEDLKNALPRDEQTEDLDRAANQEIEHYMLVYAQFVHLMPSTRTDYSLPATKEQEAAAVALRKEHDSVLEALYPFTRFVLERAKFEAEYRARRYRWFTYVSYALFACGWLIGLVGEFAKEEKPAANLNA